MTIHIHNIEEVCFLCIQETNFVFLRGASIAVEVFDNHVIGLVFNLFAAVFENRN